MSNRSLILPKVEAMIQKAELRLGKEDSSSTSNMFRASSKDNIRIDWNEHTYHRGYVNALKTVQKLLIGIGVEVQSVHYPQDLEGD